MEKRQIPYDFTHMWDKQTNKSKHIDREQSRTVVTRGERSWGREKWVKGGQLYGDQVETKLLVMNTLQCIQELK